MMAKLTLVAVAFLSFAQASPGQQGVLSRVPPELAELRRQVARLTEHTKAFFDIASRTAGSSEAQRARNLVEIASRSHGDTMSLIRVHTDLFRKLSCQEDRALGRQFMKNEAKIAEMQASGAAFQVETELTFDSPPPASIAAAMKLRDTLKDIGRELQRVQQSY